MRARRQSPVAEDPDEDVDWSYDDDEMSASGKEAGAPLLVFVHIQKTAGKTLRNIIRRLYAGGGRTVLLPNFFAKADEHWSAIDELVRRCPPDLEVAHGHMLFVPDRWPSGSHFVTILRDPVERTISHYYWLNERREARSQWRSIGEAINKGAIPDNLQVRVLAGADPPGPVTPTMAEEAIAALDRFITVGLTERFDESLVLLGRALGWRTTAYERVNATSSRVPRGTLDAATIKRIEEHNRYDRQLYAVAAERFDELVRAQPDDFQLEVDIVRAAVARTTLDARWPQQPIVLSTDGVEARALLVSSEASRLAAELDRQRLRAATRQIRLLQSKQSKARVPAGDTEENADEALRAAMARIDDLESAQRDARQKMAKARKRLRVDDGSAIAAVNKKKRPRGPNVERKPRPLRADGPKLTRG